MTAAVPMTTTTGTPLWETLADELDIAPSLYQKAADRHKSLGEWLCRPESSLARFKPNVRSQGSFRYGTVIKPIVADASYDLDQVVVLERLTTKDLSQADLKERFGAELAAYARAHGMKPPESKHRCWCLNYRDDVRFHLDSLPAVPAGDAAVRGLLSRGIEESWASPAVAITDDRHQHFRIAGGEWPTSNPRGFARWFEAQAARGRTRAFSNGARASVEDVPTYEWRTPLQRAIQILKRHRDVMFVGTPDLAPISMIITNLAARAYQGEQDVASALIGIVERMESFVQPMPPRVPNPTHPAEDYADKWRLKPVLEQNFRQWMEQVRIDVRSVSQRSLNADLVDRAFAIRLSDEQQQGLGRQSSASTTGAIGAPAIITSARRIESAPRPWRASAGHTAER